MVQSEMHAESEEEILQEVLADTEDELVLVNPTRETIRDLIYAFRRAEPTLQVRLFAARDPLRDVAEDFLLATTIADLTARGTLDVRILEAVPRHSLLLADGFVVSMVDCNDSVAGLTTDDESFVRATRAECDSRWEDAEEFSLRTPPLSEIRETLREDIGPEAAADFDRVVELLETQRGSETLDEVTVILLVAANNGELLYDISRWGEDIRLASKATFSRAKNQLEEVGLLETEKVPIDVGRPRLRLMLGNGSHGADIEEVATTAQAKLE